MMRDPTETVLFLLSSIILMKEVKGENLNIRLSQGIYYEGGILEMWKDNSWKPVCDPERRTWNKRSGDVACRQLGFSESLHIFHGDNGINWKVETNKEALPQAFQCNGNEANLGECIKSSNGRCSPQNVVSVICKKESGSACGHEAFPMLGSCYKVVEEPKNFGKAQEECQKFSSNLLEVVNELENKQVGFLLQKKFPRIISFWTGGVVQETENKQFKFWHGSQNPIQLLTSINIPKELDRPKGILFATDANRLQPSWKLEDFDKAYPFICKFSQENIGCLEDGDESGTKYSGSASHDENGSPCGPWKNSDLNHSYCRNPDGDEKPYCSIEK